MKTWQTQLTAHDACRETVDWAQSFETFQAAWDACERGDWMLWWIGRTVLGAPMSAERRPLVRIACACARLALPHLPVGEMRPLATIELAERWAQGDESVTRDQLYAAYAYAAADYAAAAAAAAAYAAYAAVVSAGPAVAAAAYAAVVSAGPAVAAAAARAKALAQCADFVRAEYPAPPQATP